MGGRRSGLYYTLVNTHLTRPRSPTSWTTAGPRRSFRRGDAGCVSELSEPTVRGLPAVALIAEGDLEGWQRYPECVAGEPSTPIADECDGQLLQYSAGSTGRPKGIRRPMRATTSAACRICRHRCSKRSASGRIRIPEPGPDLSHRTGDVVDGGTGGRRDHGNDGKFRRRTGARLHAAVRSYTRTVRTHDVRPDVAVARVERMGFDRPHCSGSSMRQRRVRRRSSAR